MRYALAVCVFAACHSTPAPAPTTPAAPAETPLHADLVAFCSADGVKHVGPMNELGPWYEPLVKSPDMKTELDHIKGGELSVPEWAKIMSKHLADAGITECPTYVALFKLKLDGTTPAP